MNTRLPQHLTCTSTPLVVGGNLRMAFTLSLGFALNDAEGRILPPNEVWGAAMQALSPEEIPDMGVPKPTAEWLMAGAACAPAAHESAACTEGTRGPVTGLPVDVAIGTLRRSFLVSGDAEDDGVSIPAPETFQQMPFSWSRTIGGPEHPENPHGCGLTSENGLRRLPNIVDRDAPGPAHPGALGLWPSRMKNLGTFDAPWLLTRWPGVPDDFDWSFYQLAQPCQRFSGYLTGNETVRITNMHPEHACIEGSLPRLRARVFLDYGSEQEPDWREAPTNADTVWLFPNSLAGLLIWHTSLPSADERGTDIRQLVVALEDTTAPPRTAEDCLASPDPVRPVAVAEPVGTPPPVPAPSVPVPPAPETPAPEGLAVAVPAAPAVPEPPAVPPASPQAELAQLVSAVKEDLPAELESINAFLREQGLPVVSAEHVIAALDSQSEKTIALLDTPDKDPEAIMKELGFPEDYLKNVMNIGTMPMPEPAAFPTPEAYKAAAEEYVDMVCAKLGAPASSRELLLDEFFPERLEQAEAQVDAQLAELGKSFAAGEMDAFTRHLDNLPLSGDDKDTLAFLEQMEGVLGLEKGTTAQQFSGMLRTLRTDLYHPENLPLHDIVSQFPDQKAAFARLQQLVQQPPEGLFDLTSLAQQAGVFGSALTALAAIDPLPTNDMPPPPPEPPAAEEVPPLPEEAPEPAELSAMPELQPLVELPHNKETLMAALASGMVLEGYNLAGLNLAGLNLANSLANTPAGPAALSGLLLDEAHCEQADFSGCNLQGARFQGASFAGARLVGANLSHCAFAGADFTGADLSHANCEGADFTGAILHNAVLTEVVCDYADFSGASLDNSRWHGARGQNVTFGPCHAENADFSRVQLPGCSFEGATLTHTLFVEASLCSGTFLNSTLNGCEYSRAHLDNLRVYDTHLAACCLAEASLADSGWLRVTTEALDARNTTATGAVFEECHFTESDWSCTSARRARWLCCDFRGSRLDRLDLLDGALRGSHMGDASLAGANLYNADLYRMGVNTGTTLLGANLGNTCLTLSERVY